MIQNIDILPDDHKKLDVIDAKNTNKSTDKNVDKTKKNDVIIVKQKKSMELLTKTILMNLQLKISIII